MEIKGEIFGPIEHFEVDTKMLEEVWDRNVRASLDNFVTKMYWKDLQELMS